MFDDVATPLDETESETESYECPECSGHVLPWSACDWCGWYDSATWALTFEGELNIHIVVGCGSAKQDEPVEAKSMYTSNYFNLKRQYAEELGTEWSIISAKHGIIDPDSVIEPYDAKVGGRGFDESAYQEQLVEQLSSGVFDDADLVLVLAGRDYVVQLEQAAERAVREGSLELTFDIVGLFQEIGFGGLGEQMGWLSDELADAAA